MTCEKQLVQMYCDVRVLGWMYNSSKDREKNGLISFCLFLCNPKINLVEQISIYTNIS